MRRKPYGVTSSYVKSVYDRYGLAQYGVAASLSGGDTTPSPSADNSILWDANESDDILWDANAVDFLLWS